MRDYRHLQPQGRRAHKARDDDAATAKQREHALDEQIAGLKNSVLELQGKLEDTQAALDKA